MVRLPCERRVRARGERRSVAQQESTHARDGGETEPVHFAAVVVKRGGRLPRNPGSMVDVRARTVRDRDGLVHEARDLVVTEQGLYYHRAIVGFAPFDHHERWILSAQGWVVNRFRFAPGRDDACDWYIEPDIIEVEGDEWHVRDGYLDVIVQECSRYDVDDADELADGIAAGEITVSDAVAVLRAFGLLCRELMATRCSVVALLERYAPDLPASRIKRLEDGSFAMESGR